MKRWLPHVPLVASLVWLLLDGRRFFLDDAQVAIEILIVTFATRSVGLGASASALAWGIGLVAPVTVLTGMALTAAGLDMTGGAGNTVIVPVIEECAKLVPIAIVATAAGRLKHGLLNLSDLLLLGCMSGAGFSMVESSYFDDVRTGIRYAPQIADINLLPSAWGTAGYVGHAAATGFIAFAFGLGRYLKRSARAGAWWWAIPAAACVWIVLEHGLANGYVNTGDRFLLGLGAGRLTPWLFFAAVAAAVAIDARNAAAVMSRSKELQKRRVLIRAFFARQWRTKQWPSVNGLRAAITQLRLLNATGWFDVR